MHPTHIPQRASSYYSPLHPLRPFPPARCGRFMQIVGYTLARHTWKDSAFVVHRAEQSRRDLLSSGSSYLDKKSVGLGDQSGRVAKWASWKALGCSKFEMFSKRGGRGRLRHPCVFLRLSCRIKLLPLLLTKERMGLRKVSQSVARTD